MPKINVLPKSVAELIAAGEVVERPSSAIKELIENSIDAGAKTITVEIKNGGVKYMRVTDDGCGIQKNDVRTAFISHATSKITTGEDLDAIFTLGFRGEALPSIAAVSKLYMLTKTADEDVGTGIEIEGGEEISFDDAGCPDGTTVIIRDLFYNTPARMKFLKKDMTEGSYVSDIVSKTAISHPEIRFSLIKDGKRVLSTPGDGKLLSAVYSIFGKEVSEALIPCEYEYKSIKVSGFISKPLNNRPNRNLQYCFVNGRYVRMPVAAAALDEAYKNRIMVGKFPMCFLFVDIPAGKIDVNVHPAKTEIRFSEDTSVFEAVFYAARSALNYGDTARPEVTLREKRDVTARKTPEGTQLSFGTAARASNAFRYTVPSEGENQTKPSEKVTAAENKADTVTDRAFVSKQDAVSDSSSVRKQETVSDKASARKPDAASDRAFVSQTADSLSQLHKEPSEENLIGKTSDSQEEKPDEGKTGDTHSRILTVEKTVSSEPQTFRDTSGVFNNMLSDREVSEKNGDTVFSSAVPEARKNIDIICDDNDEEKPSENENGEMSALFAESSASSAANDNASSHKDIRIVGEIFRTYILVEENNKLLIIDKHAAHERMIFNKLCETGFSEDSQLLMAPVSVTLSGKEYIAVTENLEVFSKGGFLVEDFGNGTVIVRECPVALVKEDISSLITEMAGELLKGNMRPVPEKLTWLYHSAACRAAVKAGDELKTEETEAFVKQLLSDDSIRYCPHGRPVMYELSQREIEKQFGRI